MPVTSRRPHRFPPKKERRKVLLAQYWWDDRVFRGVAKYASEHNWALDFKMRWNTQLPDEWTSGGIIAHTGVANPQQHLIDFIQRAVKQFGIPVVETQQQNIVGSSAVVVPHERIGEIAAEHLLSLDFREIAFVTFAENVLEAQRRSGVKRAVEAAGAHFYALEFTTLFEALKNLPKPLGLVTYFDHSALNTINACTEWGFRVPEEIAVIGVDDTEIICDLAPIPLSSVNCNYEEQGYEAAALLDRLMDGQSASATPIIIQPRGVTVRRSTDTIAIPDLNTSLFLRFLRDHFQETLSLEYIAEDLGVSLRKIQINFRRYLNRTVIQELTRIRVEHAKKLLEDPELKINTVGLESGFASRFHFIRAFQRMTGTTPGKYRADFIVKKQST
ncbi:MAG: substrate-binding domain-containing protein [Chthoniobacterales bacterium]